MADYDSIAPFYDQIHGSRKATMKWIEHLLKTYYPKAKTLLSVGCGTGEVCKTLAKKYQLTGTDISRNMLIEAKKKLPKIEFYQQDMVHLSLQENFDVIVCLFGVINHVLEFTDWQEFFKRARNHLNPGGIFIFDILTEVCLYNLVLNSPLIVQQKKLLTVCDISTDEENKFLWQTKGYQFVHGRQQGLLFNSTIRQISFSLEKIIEALKEHFSDVLLFDPEQNEVNENSELVYFVCRL